MDISTVKFQNLSPPPNEHVKVWRYISLAKFISLLITRSLYFSRIDCFSDPFEGASTEANIAMRPQLYDGKIPDEKIKELSKCFQVMPQWVYANCWHMSDIESDAMWKLYGSRDGAIAIQSTYKNLADSIKDDSCSIGTVSYIDDMTFIPENNLLTRFFYKRKSFEHEKEVRLLKFDTEFAGKLNKINPCQGTNIEVDIDTLICNIYVTPLCGPWLHEIVIDILKKYNINKPIIESKLCSPPKY
ncbi:TPA: hypothetical protein JBE46_02380 [Legionella pneumophila subsp. pneumophila]|uniref:hypothetical protein n=2 Tax=Legionella pneumophila TaxID=446 RepID=UPI0001E3C3FC|nr:hypothetical protein [Legionella pneumophila]MDC8029451.1 hypothetical protein [Legionella pneumophila subsp. pneumophila]MDW8868828.1 hypothetical protein [Legionella pneumophila]MDW8914838.1 hypothetical protein [Legionella pneumophila]MDW8924854.1 hypothetical protein [Legionella pneumophila]MDW8930384.1 hypothetical protein [Legionella pneumophila]